MNMVEPNSLVPEAHYKIVEERREKRMVGETEGQSWDNVKSNLKQQFSF